jgi:hypothetical protein
MTLYPERSPVQMQLAPGVQLDAFTTLRTSFKTIDFEYSGKYDSGPLLWDTSLTGTGSSTFNAADGAVILSTGGTASGARAIRQTHQYMIYSAGKARQTVMGMLFGVAATNVRRRAGNFDADNGLFFEQTSTGVRFVTRTNASGSPVDTAYEQSAWNLDKLDGTGDSGVTLDMSAAQGLIIDFGGYNAARVRFGFILNGNITYAHEVINQNNTSAFGIATGTLPLRYEVENTGVASGASTLKCSSSAVWSEDGYSGEFAYEFGASLGITEKAVTTRVPLISIQPKPTFGGIVNRGHIHLAMATVIARTNNARIEVVRNGTLTGPVWTSAGTNSIGQYDVTASAITGGDILAVDYVVAGSGATASRASSSRDSRFGLFNSFDGTTPDILTLVATSVTGTSNMLASMNWNEQR